LYLVSILFLRILTVLVIYFILRTPTVLSYFISKDSKKRRIRATPTPAFGKRWAERIRWSSVWVGREGDNREVGRLDN
jgi:hypothetical protein